jgi:hypothetical protein
MFWYFFDLELGELRARRTMAELGGLRAISRSGSIEIGVWSLCFGVRLVRLEFLVWDWCEIGVNNERVFWFFFHAWCSCTISTLLVCGSMM